jgi:hypothetical protein
MDKDYLNILKQTNLRPGKIKIKERKEEVLMEQDKGMNDLHAEIVKWFMEHPNPPDDEVHTFAQKMGLEPDKFEEHIYMILSDILSGGKSKDFKGTYDPTQLKMGMKVELEHTGSSLIAEKIAKDHLAEIPDYYSRLEKMEGAAGIKENVLTELFIQQGEIEAMSKGARRDMAILRISMIAELDAASFYERLADLSENKDVQETMLDVANEEKVHAGEFETLLMEVDPEYEEKQEEGEREVEDMKNE